MYKVFVHHCVILIASESSSVKGYDEVFNCDDKVPSWAVINGRIKRARKESYRILLRCRDVKKCWKHFQGKFRRIEAGGGLVRNPEGKILMIHRLGHWDLPKGKLEEGEDIATCAIREVEEECGVDGLDIENEAVTTYHVHRRNGKKILKVSYWYHMTTDYNGPLVPQTEEGIDKVKWVKQSKLGKYLSESWPSVVEVFERSGLAQMAVD